MVVGCEVYLIIFHQICCRNINWARMRETFKCLRRFLKTIDDQFCLAKNSSKKAVENGTHSMFMNCNRYITR